MRFPRCQTVVKTNIWEKNSNLWNCVEKHTENATSFFRRKIIFTKLHFNGINVMFFFSLSAFIPFSFSFPSESPSRKIVEILF